MAYVSRKNLQLMFPTVILRTLLFLLLSSVLFFTCDSNRNVVKEPDVSRSYVQELTDDNFKEKMKDGEGLRMVYFWATWCGPCRILGPTVERIADTHQGQVLVGKMDVDAHFTDSFNNVSSIPTIIFFKNGEEVHRTSGVISEASLNELIRRLL